MSDTLQVGLTDEQFLNAINEVSSVVNDAGQSLASLETVQEQVNNSRLKSYRYDVTDKRETGVHYSNKDKTFIEVTIRFEVISVANSDAEIYVDGVDKYHAPKVTAQNEITVSGFVPLGSNYHVLSGRGLKIKKWEEVSYGQ